MRLLSLALSLITVLFTGCGILSSEERTAANTNAATVIPPATALTESSEASETTIRFLENRVKGDPLDFIAHNKLGDYYLQRLRETGNVSFLDLAQRTAEASLKAVPADQNSGGLALRAQVEFAAHNFAAARDTATQLLILRPENNNRSFPYQTLGDALLELGEYDKADDAYRKMKTAGGGVAVATRLAHLAWLKGETKEAQRLFIEALNLALDQAPPSRETVAWCRWRLGELAFATGDYEAAEKHYQDSLTTFPDYFRALAGLGKAKAARGNLNEAIAHYEQAVKIIPEPAFTAALGDLYKVTGPEKQSATQYALVEQSAKLSAAAGSLYDRHLALFYADHDLKAEEAYTLARKEYEIRRDVYGADALAWTALKAGKIVEAQTAIKEALRLGTQDAQIFYHAGMIARAAGDKAMATDFLNRALRLNPQFDPLQAAIARKTLAE
jgi:tetratricopeptide (TPR) repeat protein